MNKVLGIAESIIRGIEHGDEPAAQPFKVMERHIYDSFGSVSFGDEPDESETSMRNNILALGNNLEFMSW